MSILETKEDKDDRAVAPLLEYIKKYVVPILPSVSETHTEYFGGDAEDAEVLSASLLCTCMRIFYLEILKRESLTTQEIFVLRALLAETLRAGNCDEQALVAAVRLAKCPDAKHVLRVGDYSENDHAYVRIIDRSGCSWIYDPWLDRNALFTRDEHIYKLKEIDKLKATPKPIEDAILSVSHGRALAEDLIIKYRGTLKAVKALIGKEIADPKQYAFVLRAHVVCSVTDETRLAARKLTSGMLGKFGI